MSSLIWKFKIPFEFQITITKTFFNKDKDLVMKVYFFIKSKALEYSPGWSRESKINTDVKISF